ncbi:hypothetical protein H6P81_015236 [Aristolochia fimbriata]|uniref:Mediator of RNA polymerase II transcription subunit 21 n=1 Tax=Aristolochia fimbriata TaxID=158543 RepID=A0AAV7E7V2_ARIFI|nr:hypothetical protein H6P81_015236 [Aristolochia fimbriata]
MDIISQLQEQVNTIASLAFNTFGTLQRDAPPVRLSPNYPEPPPNPYEDSVNVAEQPKAMSAALVQTAKQFDALVAALPISEGGEEAQMKKIAELEAENELVEQEFQQQLEAAEQESKLVQELFNKAADNFGCAFLLVSLDSGTLAALKFSFENPEPKPDDITWNTDVREGQGKSESPASKLIQTANNQRIVARGCEPCCNRGQALRENSSTIGYVYQGVEVLVPAKELWLSIILISSCVGSSQGLPLVGCARNVMANV